MIDRLGQLRSFLAVVDAGHFGRAAAAVGLGQSAVSQHVAAVERGVGVPLLERTSRRVALTPAGERFAPAARRLLVDAERAVAQARAIAAGELGTLRVAAQQAARALVVPETIAILQRRCPGLTIEVIPSTTAEGVAALEAGEVDVALVRDPSAREGIVSQRLASDPTMIVLPAGDPLAQRSEIPLSELRDRPRVGWNRIGAPAYHDRIAAALTAAGVDPDPRYELQGIDTRLGAVAAGLGWALESAAHAWLMVGRVCFVAIEGEPLRGELVIAWPAVGAAPGLEAFHAAAREAVGGGAQPSATASAPGSPTGARQVKPSHT